MNKANKPQNALFFHKCRVSFIETNGDMLKMGKFVGWVYFTKGKIHSN